MKMRITDVLYRIRGFFVPYMIVLCTCLIIKLSFTREAIYFTVNSHYNSFADVLFTYATDLGAGISIIVLTIAFLLFNYRAAFLFLTAFGITSLLSNIAKNLFNSPRPYLYFKDQLNHIHLIKGVEMLSHRSFPSGHTIEAFMIATVLAYVTPNKKWGFIYLLFGMLVGYSRMYLSEHFFEDVMGGSIIGTLGTVIWITIIDSSTFLHKSRWKKGLLNRDRV